MRPDNVAKGIWGYSLDSFPTLFDLVVCFGIIGVTFVNPFIRGFYLVFLTLLIMSVGLNYPNKRNVQLPELSLFCILGMIGVFVHSFVWSVKSITFEYLNFYMMAEGLLYIFFGCMFLSVVAQKASNLRLLMITIPITLIPMINKTVYCGQMTFIMATLVAVVIWLFWARKLALFTWATIIGLIVVGCNWHWICMKFACRPPIWLELAQAIRIHPWVGIGFNKYLRPDNMRVFSWPDAYLFMHNDYLTIMLFMGNSNNTIPNLNGDDKYGGYEPTRGIGHPLWQE